MIKKVKDQEILQGMSELNETLKSIKWWIIVIGLALVIF
jgi:hypothetical protein